ncbi:sarcosine oxidase subunit gamma [Rugosimonospora africana]|uniref:Sarcosine oxidase subunit gamma n=1 Tax=Rugosimonospora africana TaxID=556532 RepID=A0A8J3QU71_9ACTN|nr:sarcosine oxidase subunit gamma family protein [Rugosimonospora africana]GIH17550.1 sarcosine oxidase subunit gamma [Rugosimonospora africana]
MAEPLETTIRSPLAGWTPHPLTGIRLAELPFRTQVNLRLPAKGPAADAVGLELGVPLPVEPGTTAGSGELSVLWLGPDEWLVVGSPGADLAARLAARRGAGVSVVDTSALRTTVLVAGPRARDLLAHGCALDLHPTRFPTGRCAQTLLAHAQIVLVAVDDGTSGAEPAYHLLVRSSFANYLADWLEDAAVEYR